MDRTSRWAVVGAGVALAVLFAVLSRIGGLTENVGLFLSVFFAAFAAYVIGLAVLQSSAAARSKRLLVFVFAVAAIRNPDGVPSGPGAHGSITRGSPSLSFVIVRRIGRFSGISCRLNSAPLCAESSSAQIPSPLSPS